jgi:hypothetical protein
VEVFHRPPDYDTGEDAVVRVTASDVRRRLAQHYSREGRASEFKISLPPGGYAPEILRDPPLPPRILEPMLFSPLELPVKSVEPVPVDHEPGGRRFEGRRIFLAALTILLIGLLGGVAVLLTKHRSARQEYGAPWSLLLSAGHPLYVVLSDPDLNEIQILTGKSVSVSDYANGKLGCETLAPPLDKICTNVLRGDKVAAVDATALARIATVAASYNGTIEPHATREIRLTDLKTSRNMLFLGSRRADPWTDLFRDKVDFYIAHDDATGLQVVHNTHPKPGEKVLYVPTAGPQGTGENYTVISFVHGLTGAGYAMLLAGATHEGTDAAVAVVTDPESFSRILRGCRLSSESAAFQVLLKLTMMVGSPLTVEVVSCHEL